MIHLSQRDPRWADVKLGQSVCTVGRYGCTTTAISMLTDYFGGLNHTNGFTDPGTLASKTLQYTTDGLILWPSVNNIPCMKFEKRWYGRQDDVIQAALKDPRKAVILQVDNHHWVTGIKKNLLSNTYTVADPWLGDTCVVPGRYGAITGFTTFTAS